MSASGADTFLIIEYQLKQDERQNFTKMWQTSDNKYFKNNQKRQIADGS